MPTLTEARAAYERAWDAASNMTPDAATALVQACWVQLKLAMRMAREP
jgi:hypothetical protein